MLELVCYLLALIFAGLAVATPPIHASVDRLWLLCAAFTCFVIPLLVHAAEAV